MKLLIDNFDGQGAQDYTAFPETGKSAGIVRKLNAPAELKVSLVGGAGNFVVPVAGARITLSRSDGSNLFAGYVTDTPTYQYQGWGEQGKIYRYEVAAQSDMMLLDEKAAPVCPPFLARSAGGALRHLAEIALPGAFDYSGVLAGDAIASYTVQPEKKWSASAAEIAVMGRCSLRDDSGKLVFGPLGQNSYALDEGAANYVPAGVELKRQYRVLNDVTVLGRVEPDAHVKDYFVGNGLSTKFYLSQIPFTRGQGTSRGSVTSTTSRTILDEEYATLDPTRWVVTDPQKAISVSGGKLQVAGGTGVDGQTLLNFIEQIELGGATVLQHGDFAFNAASDGVIGGLYARAVSIAGCLAGFRVTANGSNCNVQALIGGAVAGTALTTQPGHHYQLTTRFYASEVYRMEQVFHSSLHPSGAARGGAANAADVRVVLEVHDIDPTNPASQVAPAVVLYDDVIANAPGYCTYALINAANMQCSTTYTRILIAVDAQVLTKPQWGQAQTSAQVGSLLEGAKCHVSEEPALQFYPEYVPAANELIEVHYRGRGRARARVVDPVSIAAHQHGCDDGVRGGVRQIGLPPPRTALECETAALALLDDALEGWTGEYRVWNAFLPGGATDIFPGDGLQVNAPSQAAEFLAIVKEVEIELRDLAGENSHYTLRFVDAGDPSLGFTFEHVTANQATPLAAMDVSMVGAAYLADLSGSAVTNVTSTTVSLDAGYTPGAGEGIEVRYSDEGWGASDDRNLAGRFDTRSFTLPRVTGRAQTFFLKLYDSSTPPKYSRYAAALHVDYPL